MCLRIFLLINLLCSITASAHELRVAFWDGAAPYNVKTEHGWRGPCVDVYRALEKIAPELHFTLDQNVMPIRRVEYEMQSGRREIICGARKNPSREASGMQFLKLPLHVTGYRLAVRVEDTIDVSSWDEILKLGNQGVVLIMQGHAEVERLRNLGLVIDSGAISVEQNLQKLLSGRGRFFYHRDSYFKSLQSQQNQTAWRLLPYVFDPSPAYIVAAPGVSEELVKTLNLAYAKLVRSGQLHKILQQYQLE